MSSKLLIDESPLLFQPTLATVIGVNEAIFIQQVHYWLNPRVNKRVIEGRYWVHNTYDQWQQQFPFWGEKTIRRTIANLEDLKILISYVSTIHFKKTKFYSIDYDVLNELHVKKRSKNGSNPASGHFDQIDLPVWADAGNAGTPEAFEDRDGGLRADNLDDLGDENTLYDECEIVSLDDKTAQEPLISAVSNVAQEDPICVTPSGQNDQTDLPVWADVENQNLPEDLSLKNGSNPACGQNDQIDLVILTRLYNKDTETTTETTLPPLSSSKIENSKNENEEEEILDQLILIWNETVQAKLKSLPIFPTEKRKITLRSVFKHYFNSDRAFWKSYCEKISGTKFLMGESGSGFKVGFDWAINPDNVAKILEGVIYDKPSTEVSAGTSVELPWEEFANAMWARHAGKGYPSSWTKVCLNLAKNTNQTVSECLFEKIHPKDLSGDHAELTVPFQFILDQIQQRHRPKLEAAIREEYPHVSEISLEAGCVR